MLFFLALLIVMLAVASVIEKAVRVEKHPEAVLAVIGALILVAGMISYHTGISTSIIELVVGGIAAATPLAVLAGDPTLETLSRLGSIVLMFIAGTEIDVYVLRRTIRKSIVIGVMSFFVPFISASLVLRLLGYHGLRNLLTSTSVATTSVAILYMALKDLGIFNTWLGQTIFAGAMITDIISMLSLSIVLGRSSIISLFYIVLIPVILVLLPRVLERIVRLESAWDLELKFILMVLLVLALISESIGVHSAITSFMLGIAFSETVRSHEYIEKKMKGLGFGFFIPIFFFRAGLLMDYSSLAGSLLCFSVLALVAVIAKFVGAYIPLKLLLGVKERKLANLFNARLAIGTLAAIYGLEYGVIGTAEYSMIIGLVILSSIPVAISIHRMPPISIEEPL